MKVLAIHTVNLILDFWIFSICLSFIIERWRGVRWAIFLGPVGSLISCIRWVRANEDAREWQKWHEEERGQGGNALVLGMFDTQDQETGRVR